MLCGSPETSEIATQRVWCRGTVRYQRRIGCLCGGTETFVLATQRVVVRGTETDCTSDAAVMYILMRKCVVQRVAVYYKRMGLSHTSLGNSPVPHPLFLSPFQLTGFQLDVGGMDDVTARQIAEVCISFVSRVQRLSACGCVALLPPPKPQAIAPGVFVLEIMWYEM
ncbi:hypothetical protein F2Q68_00017116 [Brassica cretica]|uniref:Uncharacterized protein n=1 Tax=Brassica cretica TaxID=69181 RepID=A0A8S9HDJ9_BRACR|nr:hypothetical protein F2Q68_00017116 [Brassica cretica]